MIASAYRPYPSAGPDSFSVVSQVWSMNWKRPLADELDTEAVGLRPDSTWAVASRYWKLAPVCRAALRIAPMTAAFCVPVLSTNIRLGLPGRLFDRWHVSLSAN